MPRLLRQFLPFQQQLCFSIDGSSSPTISPVKPVVQVAALQKTLTVERNGPHANASDPLRWCHSLTVEILPCLGTSIVNWLWRRVPICEEEDAVASGERSSTKHRTRQSDKEQVCPRTSSRNIDRGWHRCAVKLPSPHSTPQISPELHDGFLGYLASHCVDKPDLLGVHCGPCLRSKGGSCKGRKRKFFPTVWFPTSYGCSY